MFQAEALRAPDPSTSREEGPPPGAGGSLLGLPWVAALGVTAAACSNDSASGGCPGDFGCVCVGSEDCEPGLFCSSGGHCIPEGMTSSDDGEEDDASGNPSGAPEIVNLEASMEQLSERIVAITIAAQVVDPDGLDDLVGGLAHDAADGALLGPFAQVSGGTFELGLVWLELDAIGKTDDGDALLIEVEFTDADGNSDTDEIEVLVCTGGHDACPDECVALNVEGNCGACGVTCENPYTCRESGQCCYAGQYAEYCQPSDVDELPVSSSIPLSSYSPYMGSESQPASGPPSECWRL